MNTQKTEQRRVHSDTAQPDNYESSSSSPPSTAGVIQNKTNIIKLVELANAFRERRKYEDAIRLYRVILKGVKEYPALVAGIQSELARCHALLGQYRKAKIALLKSAGIVEKKLGPQHLDRALYLHNLAVIYEAQGKYAGAKYRFEQVRDILGQTSDQDGATGLMAWNAPHTFVSALANLSGTNGVGQCKKLSNREEVIRDERKANGESPRRALHVQGGGGVDREVNEDTPHPAVPGGGRSGNRALSSPPVCTVEVIRRGPVAAAAGRSGSSVGGSKPRLPA